MDPTAPVTPAQPFMGAIPVSQMPTYPVQQVSAPASGLSGGLVNKYAQVQAAVQGAQNQANQQAQMDRAATEFKEQQAASKAKGDVGTPETSAAQIPPGEHSATGDGHADFMGAVLQGLHSLGSGVSRIFGNGQPTPAAIPAPPQGPPTALAASATQGPPTPVAAQVPQSQEDGGEVLPPIHKFSLGELAQQGVKEAWNAMTGPNHIGSGAANKAATTIAARPQNQMQMADEMSKMNGGVISRHAPNIGNQPAPAFLQGPTTGDPGPHSTILAFQDGGAVPAYGVVDGGVKGLRGFDQGGAIPQQGPSAVAPALQQGPPAPMAAPVSPEHARQEMTKAIVDAHQILHDHTLNDNDVPNNTQAIPVGTISPTEATNRQRSGGFMADGSPAPAAAMVDTQAPQAPPGSQVAAAPAANQAGTQAGPATAPSPAGSTGLLAQATQAAVANAAQQGGAAHSNEGPTDSTRPHSITADQWDAFEQRKEYAVKMAAYAGQDPGQVRAAMDANRNAWVQGGVLKYLATANAAALDSTLSPTQRSQAIEKAMKNAYYYLPDGQELQMSKTPSGQLQYQDPIRPFVDSKTGAPVSGPNVPGAQANMVPLDTQHIQMLGTAMLDPMNVQNTINNVRAAQAKIGLEQAQGQAALMTGEGNLRKGTGIQASGQAHLQRVSSENWKDLASGQADLIRANAVANHLTNIVRANHIDPQLMKGAQEAGTIFEQTAQGQLTTQPTTTTDPKTGKQVESLSPGAGRPMRDPTKIPPELQGASPADIMDGKAMAQKIFLGSSGTIATAEAARLAALYTQQKRNPKGGPDGKQAGVQTDPRTGDTHVWNPAKKSWEAFKLPILGSSGQPATVGPSTADLDPLARDILARGSSDQGAVPSSSPEAADTPDMEDQKFPAES